MAEHRLILDRDRILAFRRVGGALDERLPPGADSLRRAAWAGLQDSMPRAALLSINARVEGTEPTSLDDPSLVQIWGPRWSTYVVAASDLAVFTLGRMSVGPRDQAFAQRLADHLEAFLAGRRLGYGEAGHGMGIPPNRLRYATVTGRVVMRWDGAHRPTIWTVPAPSGDPAEARRELARRYLHVFGPTTSAAFAQWVGIGAEGHATFEMLRGELVPVGTPIGDAWILASDEAAFMTPTPPPTAVRLLPSGDAWYLLQARDRELLVADPVRRGELWTSRVWPGAVLVAGEVVGTWRRAQATLSISTWRDLSPSERAAIGAEAASLPLPGVDRDIVVRWQA